MKQGSSPEALPVLDKVAELEVAMRGVSTEPIADNLAWCRQEFDDSYIGRFLSQARSGGHGNPWFATDLGEGWREGAQFEILPRDVRTVLYAADKTLEEIGLLSRIRKPVRARHAAAQSISSALESHRIAED